MRNHEKMCPNNPDDSYRKKFTTKGKPGWNKGLTKETSSSVAKYAKSLTKDIPDWQAIVDDDGKLHRRYINKRVNAEKENLKCELTFEEYCNLVRVAGIKSSQLGFTGDGYVLARYGDTGNYTVSNCRFITQAENAREKRLSQKSIEASRDNMKRLNDRRKNDPELQASIMKKILASDYFVSRSANKKIVHKDSRYCGTHNSQFGTYWITNGVENKKWSGDESTIPSGFRKGRVMNSNK